MGQSLASSFLKLPLDERRKRLEHLTKAERAELPYRWRFWARPEQISPESDWRVWLILSGRGWGKTRTGAEWVREQIALGRGRMALIGATAADVRDVMIEGPSGLLAICPEWNRPKYEPSKRRITWPNGAVTIAYSADEPDRLRGPQHDGGWCDELAAWSRPETWDQFLFGLRLGQKPQAVVTTTPRPTEIIRRLARDPTTHLTRGSTFDNAQNLADTFLEDIKRRFEGTRLGRQELEGAILDDNPAALWQRDRDIETHRWKEALPSFSRVVVGVDPSVSDGEKSAHTGIVVAAVDQRNKGRAQGFVLEDGSVHGSPSEWAAVVQTLYHKYHADCVIAEANQGGKMVEAVLQAGLAKTLPVRLVHASRGKEVRAEPVSLLYEQGRVHHVGAFPELEDQMCNWTPGDTSPDRMDALVWALTELLVEDKPLSNAVPILPSQRFASAAR